MENDLISRSALLKAFENNIDTDVCQEDADYQYLWGFSWETVESALKTAPAVDAVEVVRCRYCEYWKKAKVNKKGFLICPASGMEITARAFSSYGERRFDNAD